MNPTLLDQSLLVVGIAAYVTGTLVLLAYFLTRSTVMKTIGIPLAIVGCVAQFAELGARWNMTGIWPLTNLYGSLSLFSVRAYSASRQSRSGMRRHGTKATCRRFRRCNRTGSKCTFRS